MSELTTITSLVEKHLNCIKENIHLNTFSVKKSNLGGRGIFANRNISVGELIFVDYPLIMGPKTAHERCVSCVSCYVINNTANECINGCGLPICSVKCQKSLSHEAECKLINSWKATEARKSLDSRCFSRSFIPLRALLLNENDKEFLLNLATHNSSKHGAEVKYMKQFFDIPENDENLMMQTCRVLDANAFDMLIRIDENNNSNLRGLFPVAALMNHSCTPNIRIDFDYLGRMYVRARTTIPEGAEILTAYANLLCGTPARRLHLLGSKHFLCNCPRCSDKTEFGTRLAALRCLDRSCTGDLLPSNPLDFSSNWCCEVCSTEVVPRRIGALQSALAGFISTIKLDDPNDIYDFVTQKLKRFLPESNHIILDLKSRIINVMGNSEGFKWNGKYIFLSALNRIMLSFASLKNILKHICQVRAKTFIN